MSYRPRLVESCVNMANLVSVKFVGRTASVVDPDGLGEVEVVVGETLKVTAEVAHDLLQQPANWVLAPTKETDR